MNTSAAALDKITSSGKRPAQNDLIAAVVDAMPGCTVYDIGRELQISHFRIAKRTGAIAKRGYRPGPARHVPETQSEMQTWWPAGPQEQRELF